MSASETLMAMGVHFEEHNHPLQAIKCYEAVCKVRGPSLPPETQIEARLSLARLLLTHTHNIFEAKAHLEQAQAVAQAKNSLVPLPLKLRVYDGLIQALSHLPPTKLLKQLINKALETIKSESSGPYAAQAPRYRYHFQARLAEAWLQEGDAGGYERGLAAALEGLQSTPTARDLILPAALHLADARALSGDAGGAIQALTLAADAAKELAAAAPPPAWLPIASLHLAVLQTSLFLWTGRADIVGVGGGLAVVESMEAHVKNLDRMWEEIEASSSSSPFPPSPLQWLSTDALGAYVQLAVGTVLRQLGKGAEAIARAGKGIAYIESDLVRLGVAPSATESDLGLTRLSDIRRALLLQGLLVECSGLALLQGTDLVGAGETIRGIMKLIDKFPGLVGPQLKSSAHLLAGLYLQSTAEVGPALDHFSQAAASAPARLPQHKTMAAVFSCLTLLGRHVESGAGPEGADAQAALRALGPVYDACEGAAVGGGCDPLWAVCLYAGALMSSVLGHTQLAKKRVSQAVTLAHKSFGCNQLLSLVLTLFAPIRLKEGDASGGTSFLSSAYSLARQSHDLPTAVTALLAMDQLIISGLPEGQEKAKAKQHLESNLARLKKRIEAAVSDGEGVHRVIRTWGVAAAAQAAGAGGLGEAAGADSEEEIEVMCD